MDRQVDHTINNLEHKLRSCLINLRGSWDDNLPIIEFAYNNCYHSNIQMAPYRHYMGIDVDLQLVGLKYVKNPS